MDTTSQLLYSTAPYCTHLMKNLNSQRMVYVNVCYREKEKNEL